MPNKSLPLNSYIEYGRVLNPPISLYLFILNKLYKPFGPYILVFTPQFYANNVY